jgi:hypothetical protein
MERREKELLERMPTYYPILKDIIEEALKRKRIDI